MSESEPELGLGIVKQVTNGKILIRYATSGITRQYSLTRAPIKRIRFKEGDLLTTKSGESLLVEGVREKGGLLSYLHQDRSVCETELADTIPVNSPQDRLRELDFDPVEAFELRYKTLVARERIMQAPARGFCGARIELFPHQLYIADVVSRRHVPRVMLSDQVGLGKTIEALLVINKLIISGRINSVLILAPEHLVLQWFGELFHRFNLTFAVIDEKYCLSQKRADKYFDPFAEKRFTICSYSVLTMLPELRDLTLAAEWDMVVIDEVHNLHQASEEYEYFKELSGLTTGLMLLTAIPEYPNLEDFFARLHLLDPVLYDKYDRFFWEVDGFKKTAALAEKIRKNSKLTDDQIALLREKVPAVYLNAADGDVPKLDNESRLRILEYLIDQHGMGRLLFRNTRKTISGFPQRIVQLMALAPLQEQHAKQQLLLEFRYDLNEETQQPDYNFSADSRIIWLLSLLKKAEKILLICSTLHKANAIEAALRQKGFKSLLTFHEDMDFIERDRRVASFYEARGPQLLVSSEIGSEGRNFQFCRNLVFFDLPFNPSLIEQRIGRLDRIGQKGPINLFIPYPQDSPQGVIANWFHSGLNIFNEFHDGHIQTFSIYSGIIRKMALSGNVSSAELEHLIDETRKEYQRVKKINENGRDVLVELNSFSQGRAGEIIASINTQDENIEFEDWLVELLEFYGFCLDKIDERTYRINTTDVASGAFAQMVPEGLIITFDRQKATERTDYAFVTIDHELAARALDLLLGQAGGSSSCAVWFTDKEQGVLLEVVYLLECIAPPAYNTSRYLPITPLRVLVNEDLNDLTAEISFEMICEQISLEDTGKHPELQLLIQESSVRMLEKSRSLAEATAAELRAKASRCADQIIGQEINRLTALKKVNQHIKEEEILQAQTELDAVKNFISAARLRMDSLRLIQKIAE